MSNPLPAGARLRVSNGEAAALAAAVRQLPGIESEWLRAFAFQRELRQELAGLTDAYSEVVDRIRMRLCEWPHAVVIEGLSFDDSNVLFGLLCAGFGDLFEPYGGSFRLLQPIEPATDPAGGTYVERPHTDSTNWPVPNDLTCLLCLTADGEGGASRILPAEWVRGELTRIAGIGSVHELERESVPWRMGDPFGAGVRWSPVFSGEQIRWLHYTIGLALSDVSPDTFPIGTVQTLDAALQSPSRWLEFRLSPGELLVLDNRRCLHSRSPVSSRARSPRRLVRAKVVLASEVSHGPSGADG